MREETEHADVVRWYTRARKFPQLLGRTPDGTRLWGGPYTVTQAIGGGVVIFLGVKTMGLWGSFGLVGNALILLSAAAGTVFGLGRIPLGARNPVAVLGGLVRAINAPATGRLGGRPVRIRRPRQLRHQVVFAATRPADFTQVVRELGGEVIDLNATPGSLNPLLTAPSASPAKPAAAQPTTAPATTAPALSGVQALLAARPAPTHGGTDR